MVRLGHDVIVFSSDEEPAWHNGNRRRRSGFSFEEYDGFKVRRVTAEPELLNMPLMSGLFEALVKGDFDIIHSHECFSSCTFQSAVVSKIKNCPLIITQHNDQMPIPMLYRLGYLLANKTMGNYSFATSKKVIVLSNDIKHHLQNLGFNKNKLKLIPTAVDTTFFSPHRENFLELKWGISEPVILFVGRLVPEKGVETLLRAFVKVVAKIPEAKLVIVGNGPLEPKLKELQNTLKIKNVFFLKKVENRLMPHIYVGCSVLVLPSYVEPFGNVVIEAMAAGKPVIGSYVGGIKDTIVHGETGFHIAAGDIEKLTFLLLKLLNDKSLNEKLGKNALIRVQKQYDSRMIAKRIERLYFDVMS